MSKEVQTKTVRTTENGENGTSPRRLFRRMDERLEIEIRGIDTEEFGDPRKMFSDDTTLVFVYAFTTGSREIVNYLFFFFLQRFGWRWTFENTEIVKKLFRNKVLPYRRFSRSSETQEKKGLLGSYRRKNRVCLRFYE